MNRVLGGAALLLATGQATLRTSRRDILAPGLAWWVSMRSQALFAIPLACCFPVTAGDYFAGKSAAAWFHLEPRMLGR
jgi:hypothetical protein